MKENIMLKIAYFDDDQDSINDVKALFEIVSDENDIKVNFTSYVNYRNLIKKIIDNSFDYNYLILDVYDQEKDENVAIKILNQLKAKKIMTTKVILYSIGSTTTGAVSQIKYSKDEFPFLMEEHIIPKASIDDLGEKIINDFLENNISVQFDYLDKDDILLKAEINSIGDKYISLIIGKIKKEKNIRSLILIERMSSGFSGASVFKLRIENKISILKISKDKEKLDLEFENAEKYYSLLPPPFRIKIDNRDDFSTNGIGAYLIENVPKGFTLFDFLANTIDNKIITGFLQNLFIEGNCMKYFYSDNIKSVEKYCHINRNFNNNNIKYCKVKMAFMELSPFLVDEQLNFMLIYINSNNYKNIKPDGANRNNVVICHGDFHSKNIMESNGDPIIIDTGGMKEDYWCMDICRLITNIFIEGFDHGTKKYYDINEIENQVAIAEKIINLEKIESDTVKVGYITALNWIIANVEEIYGEMFCKWEFQLGLLKEFLQVSYRKNTIPPNKRVIAILSAFKCLESANSLFC
jgi:hypothetical protein